MSVEGSSHIQQSQESIEITPAKPLRTEQANIIDKADKASELSSHLTIDPPVESNVSQRRATSVKMPYLQRVTEFFKKTFPKNMQAAVQSRVMHQTMHERELLQLDKLRQKEIVKLAPETISLTEVPSLLVRKDEAITINDPKLEQVLGEDYNKPITEQNSVNGGVHAKVKTCAGNNLKIYSKTYIDRKNVGLMRSEVIDTAGRFTDWIDGIDQTNIERLAKAEIIPIIGTQVRATSIQLNSFAGETSRIEKQRYLIAEHNHKHPDTHQIAHVITPTNGYYTWAKRLGKFGQWLFGENKAKRYNLPTWATYSTWMAEDFRKLKEGAFPSKMTKPVYHFIGETHDLENLKNQLNKMIVEKADKSEITLVENQIREKLLNVHESLKTLENACGETAVRNDPTVKSILQKATLFRQILGSQLNIPGADIDRDHEHKMLVLLNMMMDLNKDANTADVKGVNTLINCFSGSDRTGYLHATATTMHQLENSGYSNDELFDFVQKWDVVSTDMNKRTAQLDKLSKEFKLEELGSKIDKLTAVMEKINARSFSKDGDANKYTRIKEERGSLQKQYDTGFKSWSEKYEVLMSDKDPVVNKRMQMVRKFRNYNTNNLVQIGLSITLSIFGVMGLKWQKGIALNRVPVNSLEPYIFITDARGHKRVVKIVEYDSKGKVSDLTKDGHKFLTKFQDLRSGHVKHKKKSAK